ncbi:hypothetical protein, partial [Legionella feeleii]|uniref:hypothetical protein n=1 Tax=Legionella feeleii TaxID=453 RepID=UPI001A94AA57
MIEIKRILAFFIEVFMKVQKIKLSSYHVTWIVLDDNHLPIKPITEFVRSYCQFWCMSKISSSGLPVRLFNNLHS